MINVGRKGMREQNARIAQQPIRDMNPGADWPFGHLGNARWVAVTELKMGRSHWMKNELFYIQKAYSNFVCNILWPTVHKISDMGRELNKMDLTLRLGVVDYCMRRYEARAWLNLAKVQYAIGPHLYFKLHSVSADVSFYKVDLWSGIFEKRTNMSKTWLRLKLPVLWWLAQHYSHG